MENKQLGKKEFLDKSGKPTLIFALYATKKGNSCFFRTTDKLKRWGKAFGPYESERVAFLDFVKRFRKNMSIVLRKEFVFFLDKSHRQFDGIVTLEISENADGYYPMLSIGDKLIWSSSAEYTALSDAIIQADIALNYHYPRIEAYDEQT